MNRIHYRFVVRTLPEHLVLACAAKKGWGVDDKRNIWEVVDESEVERSVTYVDVVRALQGAKAAAATDIRREVIVETSVKRGNTWETIRTARVGVTGPVREESSGVSK